MNNAKRTAEEAEKKRAARKRKAEDALFKSVQDSPAILARIDSLTDLKKLKRPELITLHLSIFRRNLRGQPKKSELIAALSPEILKELEKTFNSRSLTLNCPAYRRQRPSTKMTLNCQKWQKISRHRPLKRH